MGPGAAARMMPPMGAAYGCNVLPNPGCPPTGGIDGGDSFAFMQEPKKDAFAFVGDEIGKNKRQI